MNPFTLSSAIHHAGQPAVGRAVRRVRWRCGASRLCLARAIGVRYRTIVALELGRLDVPVALLERVCHGLGVCPVVLSQEILNESYIAEIGGERRLLAGLKEC